MVQRNFRSDFCDTRNKNKDSEFAKEVGASNCLEKF